MTSWREDGSVTSTVSVLDVIEAVGSWVSAIGAIVAIYVALYANYDAKTPQVVAFLEYDKDHGCMSFIVANYGKGVARNISISGFDSSLVLDGLMSNIERSFVYQGIPVLVPGASMETVVFAASEKKKIPEASATVTVTYVCKGFPFGMKKVTDKFVIDYGSFSGSVHTDSDEHRIMVATEGIAKSLQAMGKKGLR